MFWMCLCARINCISIILVDGATESKKKKKKKKLVSESNKFIEAQKKRRMNACSWTRPLQTEF